MSARCTGWVLRHGPRPTEIVSRSQARRQRAVLGVIADAANSDGEHAHPGLDNMIEGTLYERASVLATLDELHSQGWIETTQKCSPGNATVYRMLMDEPPEAPGQQVQGLDPSQVQDLDPSPQATGPKNGAHGSKTEGSRVQNGAETPIASTKVYPSSSTAPSPALALSPRQQAMFAIGQSRAQAAAVTATDERTPAKRETDEIWDALMAACSIDTGQIPKSARGAYNTAVRDLKAIGATPEQIAAKAEAWRRSWRDVTMTPSALARRWGEIPDHSVRVSGSMKALQTFAAGDDDPR